jgi:hypothetical protein
MYLQNVDLRKTSVGLPHADTDLVSGGRLGFLFLFLNPSRAAADPAVSCSGVREYIGHADGKDHGEAGYSSSKHIRQDFSNL